MFRMFRTKNLFRRKKMGEMKTKASCITITATKTTTTTTRPPTTTMTSTGNPDLPACCFPSEKRRGSFSTKPRRRCRNLLRESACIAPNNIAAVFFRFADFVLFFYCYYWIAEDQKHILASNDLNDCVDFQRCKVY